MNEKQLKTIKGAKYRVVTGDDCVFSKGAMIQLADDSVVDDDGAEYTQEGNSYGSHYMYFHEIELVELPESVLDGDIAAAALTKVVAPEERVEVLEQAAEEPEQAEETPEPLYAVGQKLRVKGNEHPIMHLFRLGTEVEVLEVHRVGNEESDSVRYDYLTEPVVGGFTQFISEDDLEPVLHLINPKGTVITAGSYYAAEGTLYDVVIKVTEVQPESGEWAYTVPNYDSSRLLKLGLESVTGSAYFATAVPATPEQIEKFKQLENPEHAEEDGEQDSEFDNPEVEVGKIYMDDDGWMFYCDDVSKVTKGDYGIRKIYVHDVTAFNADGELELEANYGCDNYREATPEEANKLLRAVIQQKVA